MGEVPPGVVTDTSTTPAAREGRVAVIWVAELTVKVARFPGPKLTAVVPRRSVPVSTTEVFPAVGPWLGATVVTAGTLS